MYNVHIDCNVHSTPDTIHWTMYTLYSEICSLHCIVYIVQCILSHFNIEGENVI